MFSTAGAGTTMVGASAGSCTDIETTIGDTEIETTGGAGGDVIATGITGGTATKLPKTLRGSPASRWGAAFALHCRLHPLPRES